MYDSLLNEYLIIHKSDGEIVDYRKWNGEEYHALSYKQINSKFTGKIKPRNPQQVLAFDMLQNKDETIKSSLRSFWLRQRLFNDCKCIEINRRWKI